MEREEILGGDFSGFKLSTGGYYLCRRDFFELMEVGRLTPGWFSILVGDTINNTVRGWRKTGRPQQSYQSFTELKTIRCIIDGPQSEEIYKITRMAKPSLLVDETIEFDIHEIMRLRCTSEVSDAQTKPPEMDRDMDMDMDTNTNMNMNTNTNMDIFMEDFDMSNIMWDVDYDMFKP